MVNSIKIGGLIQPEYGKTTAESEAYTIDNRYGVDKYDTHNRVHWKTVAGDGTLEDFNGTFDCDTQYRAEVKVVSADYFVFDNKENINVTWTGNFSLETFDYDALHNIATLIFAPPVIEHEWGAWETSAGKAATCEDYGEEFAVCAHDGTHKKTRITDFLGHDFGEFTVTKAATCTQTGERTCVCSRDADHKVTEVIEALGHDPSDWIVDVAATGTTAGSRHKECKRCHVTLETEKIPATGEAGQQGDSGNQQASGGQNNSGTGQNGSSSQSTDNSTPAGKNEVIKDSDGTQYKVTENKKGKEEVTYEGPAKNAKGTVKVPKQVTIGNTTYKVTKIKAGAFKNNKKITKIVVEKNITTIGDNAFSGCTKLKTVKLGSKVSKIGNNAFKNCSALKSIVIPASVKSIGKGAFTGCKKLEKVIFKTKKLKAKKVGANALKGIPAKAKVKVPAKAKKSYEKFFYKRGLSKKIKLSDK